MHIKSAWSYVNKGLLIILSLLIISTLSSVVYLIYTLQSLHAFTTTGSNAVGTAFVLQDLLINMQEAENGVRGYVLTGDTSFLDRYTTAQKQIPTNLNMIVSDKNLFLTRAQSQQIISLSRQKLQNMETTVSLERDQGHESAASFVANKQGDTIMTALKNQINDISSVGLRNIGPMRNRSEANLRRALVVSGALGVFVVGACGAVMWYFQRAILRERALESTKNEFLSLASHQLRTPATNVKQYLGLLMDGYMGDLTEKQHQALAVAYKNNESEISIMNNLLDVAKLDLERIQLHKKVTNIMSVARSVVRDHATIATERKQRIVLMGQKQVLARVDADYIKGVIENLVDNSIKYSNDGTEITVEVSREEDNARISVRDQGLGIKKRDYGKLFNKFSRLDNEFSASSQGSGLGLYWVKQIVNLHHGIITVNSREGKGSEFIVRLPIR